jgi:beta-galactosidase
VPAASQGSLIWVDFDGVYKNSDIWLNGAFLGHFTSGYVSFRYYLHNASMTSGSPHVLVYGGGDNVLAVRVDALSEQEGWFYEGGGITRSVWLNMADPLSITPWGAYHPSSITGLITSGPLGAMGPQTAASALISSQVDVANARTAAVNFTLLITVLDASGTSVGTSSTAQYLTPGATGRFVPTLTLGSVNLWNTEVSYLYTVQTAIVLAGATVDSTTVTIGIRNAIWTANTGFMLNGFKIAAQGYSNHQDFAGVGVAVPNRVQEFRVTSLRAIGSNFWRTAHNVRVIATLSCLLYVAHPAPTPAAAQP